MATVAYVLYAAVALVSFSRAQQPSSGPGVVTGVSQIGQMDDTFTVPRSEYTGGASACTKVMAGCTGTFVNGDLHSVEGTITVLDDCTFEISGWQFDGTGPAVEWWAAMQTGQAKFPYPANAKKIGELGAPGSYQTGSDHGGDSEVVVRLGLELDGSQTVLSPEFNHISLWCEDFAVDFGNVALNCPDAATVAAAGADPTATNGTDSGAAAGTEVSGAAAAGTLALVAVAAVGAAAILL